jgi:hypothetical protein
MSESNIITISKDHYEELIACQRKLEALEAAGVDNWEGYGYAMDLLKVMESEES